MSIEVALNSPMVLSADKIRNTEGVLEDSAIVSALARTIELYKDLREDESCRIGIMSIDPLIGEFHSVKNFAKRHGIKTIKNRVYRFSSGSSFTEILSATKEQIEGGTLDAVLVIAGDRLQTDKEINGHNFVLNRMKIYNNDSVLYEYDRNAHKLMETLGITKEEFRAFADAAFDNYVKAYKKFYGCNPKLTTEEKLNRDVTDLFRVKDCSNPFLDFFGTMLIGSQSLAGELGIKNKTHVLGSHEISRFSPQMFILKYGHLSEAYYTACSQAGLNFKKLFLDGHALFNAYTCFPSQTAISIRATHLVESREELIPFLENNLITIAGGMPINRAAWSSHVFEAVIDSLSYIESGKNPAALFIGNGGGSVSQGASFIGDINSNILRQKKYNFIRPERLDLGITSIPIYKS